MVDLQWSEGAHDWVVVGWFTPDYAALANKFAYNLRCYKAPYHLYGMEPLSGRGWDTTRKPEIVRFAMADHPGKTIVLMDVDCIVMGDISAFTDFLGDISFHMNIWQEPPRNWIRRKLPHHGRHRVQASSRVMAFRPTRAASDFADAWRERCKAHTDDEIALIFAYLRDCSIARSQPERQFIAWEWGNISAPANTVIWHQSEHAKNKPLTFSEMLRKLEKPFRTGRSRRLKAQGTL